MRKRISNIISLIKRYPNSYAVQWYPARGACAYCGKEVYHNNPWYAKDPKKDKKRPLHDKCAEHYIRNYIYDR